MKCPQCQRDIPDDSRLCSYCGIRIDETQGNADPLDTLITTYHLVPGSVIAGRYQIQEMIGRGGMGIVYRALDRELSIEVALKVLPPELGQDERAIEDLKNEARAAMKLAHPNIVHMYSFQSHEGLNFLIMEYVNGPNLSRVLGKEKRFSIKKTLSIARQVCMGLAYAHKKCVIHRDIKPQNLMQDEDGTIKIADFGIARVISDTMSRVSQRPTTGTLVYMSPEQLRGKRIDQRSDIYSFGCCLYEFLSGRPPFWTGDIYHQHLEEEPERLPDVPDNINNMLSICLAKDPQMRYQSAEDLLRAIERVERGGEEPRHVAKQLQQKAEEKAQKVHPEQKVGKPVRAPTRKSRKTLLILMAIVLIAGIILAVNLTDWFGSIRKAPLIKQPAQGTEEPSRETQPVQPTSDRLEALEADAPHSTIVVPSINYKMVYIPPGAFMMGSPSDEQGRDDNEIQHRVTLTQGFYMGVTEVTQGQWRFIMGNNPSYFGNSGDDYPVEQVSWKDCQEFIKRINRKECTNTYRLPTEAEWEYACRAGSSTALANGNIIEPRCGYEPNLDKMDWYCGNANGTTHPVAQKSPNAWWLYDMQGNVSEWCQDNCEWKSGVLTDTYMDGIIDPSCKVGSDRVFRGGSWYRGAWFCRSADRGGNTPILRSSELGFRLARTP